jgi:hypothetical protein
MLSENGSAVHFDLKASFIIAERLGYPTKDDAL